MNVNDYVLWKDGLYKFEDMPLHEVANRVRRYYNMNILVSDEQLANTLVSGKLVLTGDFEEVMQYLSKTVEMKYEKTKDGTYILK